MVVMMTAATNNFAVLGANAPITTTTWIGGMMGGGRGRVGEEESGVGVEDKMGTRKPGKTSFMI